MRTNIISFVFSSENRIEIVKTLQSYPNRQWSCSTLEELTKLAHATVFRTLHSLHEFGVLKSIRINKRDLIYEIVSESPQWQELQRAVNINKITVQKIAQEFIEYIKSPKIKAIILYGSSVKGEIKPESDIDIFILSKKGKNEKEIQDAAAHISLKVNKTISVLIMNVAEFQREKKSAFLQSIKESMEVLYGKNPF